MPELKLNRQKPNPTLKPVIAVISTHMISGTKYSPAKAFISFAREFFEALAIDDYQSALGKLDSSEIRWSKKKLIEQLNLVTGHEKICSSVEFTKSASPQIEKSEFGYTLIHRLPVNGKWIDAKVIFDFVRKPETDYYKVWLRGFAH